MATLAIHSLFRGYSKRLSSFCGVLERKQSTTSKACGCDTPPCQPKEKDPCHVPQLPPVQAKLCDPPTQIPCCPPPMETHPCAFKPYPPPEDFPPREPSREAVEVVFGSQGDPCKVLRTRTTECKRPLERKEMIIQMILAPMNPLDLAVISGEYVDLCHCRFPARAGIEGVAQVLEVGCDVTKFVPGNIVLPAEFGFGTWRTQASCFEHDVIGLPSDISFVNAAHLSVAPSTAWRLLKCVEKLEAGDVIIQSAANSAIGRAVIQLAKAWGIRTINVVRDRPDVQLLMNQLYEIGATHVITDNFLNCSQMCYLIRQLGTCPKMVIDCVGGKIACDMAKRLPCNGMFASYGDLTWDPAAFNPRMLPIRYRQVKVYGFWRSQWVAEHCSVNMLKVMDEICSYMRTGEFKSPEYEIISFKKFHQGLKKVLVPFKEKRVLLRIDESLRIPPCEYCYQNVEHRICRF